MIYLEQFQLPSSDGESSCFNNYSPTYYTSLYPFHVFPYKGLSTIKFSDITIFCGSNGSGKSTLLNIISENLEIKRDSMFNKTELYDEYVELTKAQLREIDPIKLHDVLEMSRIITSDDVFNHILDVRERNTRIDFKREVLLQQRRRQLSSDKMPSHIDCTDPKSVEAYKQACDFRKLSASEVVRRYASPNERTLSNGENGYKYFTDAIQPGGLYLLDEPENSLSANLQIELSEYIMGMACFYDCQFIISSHSPFMLAMPFARIYDLDTTPVVTKKWTEIPSVRAYYNFFKDHEKELQ